jgi:2-keto-3-deoxy-L-fuconate dehydrogenase
VARLMNDFAGLSAVVTGGASGIGLAIATQDGIENNDDAEWQRVLDVNVIGLVRVSRAALPALRRSAHAAIVARRRLARCRETHQRVPVVGCYD